MSVCVCASVCVQVVSGPAIPVPVPAVKGGPVDPALVEEYLHKYITAVEQLYERHKHAAGYGNNTLVVM